MDSSEKEFFDHENHTCCLLLAACTHNYRLGQFTAASSHNVRHLDYNTPRKSRTTGESCLKSFLGIQWGDHTDRLQRAMDNAIKNGQNRGIDGDLLVNVRLDIGKFNLVVGTSNCYKVEGNLVSLKKEPKK